MLPDTAVAPLPLHVATLPSVLYLEVSNYCNSLCATCPLTFFGNGAPHHMTLDDVRRIVEQAPDLQRAVLHGIGEPLLNPQLPRMIAYLKARGVHVLFNSNAILLTPRRQRQLIDAGLDEYRASLDASTPETYRAIRGVPAYERVTRNLASFMATKRELGADRPLVSLWFTTLKENLPELPGVVAFAAEHGIGEVHVQRLVYFGEGMAREEQSLFRKLQAQEEAILAACVARCREHGILFSAAGATEPIESLSGSAAARPWQRCRRPWSHSYITASGDVLPCCFVPFVARDQTPFVLGNAFTQPLVEVWNGERYQEFRRRFQTDQPPACCEGCGAKWSM